jgi:PAS domain S-box-containing protein
MDDGLKNQLEGLFSELSETPRAEESAPEEFVGHDDGYRSLVENLAIGVYRSTPEPGSFVLANSAFLRMFGFGSQAELAQIVPAELFVNTEEGERFFDHLWSMGRVTGAELELRKKDGTSILCSISATAVYGTEGQVAYYDCTLEDITGRKWAAAETESWKQRYEQVAAFLGQVVYDYNTQTGSIVWGASLEPVLGYSQAQMNGGINQWAGLIHPEDQGTLLGALDAAEEACGPYEIEYRIRHKNGQYIRMHERGFFTPDSAGKSAHRLGVMQKIIGPELARSSPPQAAESTGQDAEQAKAAEYAIPQAPQSENAQKDPARAGRSVPPVSAESVSASDELYRRVVTLIKDRLGH